MSRPLDAKPDSCTERGDVDPTGISVKVSAQYPGRSGGLPKPEALRLRPTDEDLSAGTLLMDAVVERNNLFQAYDRVVKNAGAPGVDGLTASAFKPWLQRRGATLRKASGGSSISIWRSSSVRQDKPGAFSGCRARLGMNGC